MLYLQHSVVPSTLLPCLSTHQHFLFPCLSKTVHCSGRKYPSWSHDGKWIPGTGCPSPLTNSNGRFCRNLFRQGGTETDNRFFIYVALITYCSASDNKAQLQKKKPAVSWTFIKSSGIAHTKYSSYYYNAKVSIEASKFHRILPKSSLPTFYIKFHLSRSCRALLNQCSLLNLNKIEEMALPGS